jgi:polyisoprenoid-binding protein YceI
MAAENKRTRHRANLAGRACIVAMLAVVTARAWTQSPQTTLQAKPGEVILRLDPAQSKLHWTLGSTLHTVHGTFALKRGEVRFDPASGSASGEIVADATSGASGNEGRDKKMHREILESSRYGEVIFRPTRLEGKVSTQGSSHVQVQGTFLLHGSEHELTVPIDAELAGDHWKGSAKFGVPYIQWGLKSPNTFFAKADPVVEIELEMSGALQRASAQ